MILTQLSKEKPQAIHGRLHFVVKHPFVNLASGFLITAANCTSTLFHIFEVLSGMLLVGTTEISNDLIYTSCRITMVT